MATHTDDSPTMKAASRRVDIALGKLRRMRAQPRAKTSAARAAASVAGTSSRAWPGCDTAVYGRRDDATACEASRAGACPAGYSVSRNATRAVGPARLRFFP